VGDVGAGHLRNVFQRRLSSLSSVLTIVVPYRGDAKRRLPSSIRAALALAMLGDVVAAALEVGRVVVVTDDPAAVPRGAEVVDDPGAGLGAAVGAGLTGAKGHALVVNADLPAATPEALRRLADAGLALVEAPDGTTNALSLPDPRLFAPLYGPGSADRFRAHAPFATVDLPELVHDVDDEGDLDAVRPSLGPRTRALVSVTA
jgi:2-phospho-L-lactate/phosphoenolpyruvate guanylyltransferase